MNIIEIFKKTERELLDYLPEILIQKGYAKDNILVTDDYIYAKGNIPVMLVAHLDTVHSQTPINIFKDIEFNVMWSPQGLGADDRAGVYAILKLLDLHKPYIVFTTDEEMGGLGARKVAKDLNFNLQEIKFIIELDRQGKDDAVFYDCDNDLFTQYITSFGFNKNYGSFSDISIICPIWGIAGVNLSIGYYLQHTKQEHLNIKELEQTINKVRNVFNNLPSYGFEYIPNIIQEEEEEWDEYEECDRCSFCGIEILEDEICYENEGMISCLDCYGKEYFYCENCDSYYEINKKSILDGICEKCFKEIMMA